MAIINIVASRITTFYSAVKIQENSISRLELVTALRSFQCNIPSGTFPLSGRLHLWTYVQPQL